MKDTARHQGLRKKLVALLSAEGIQDKKVLQAIGKTPRHWFVPSVFTERSYENIALRIDEEQTISQPYTVAFQSEILKIEDGDRVLEIGTGSGYQAAILYEMGAEVYTIERIKKLHDKTSRLLRSVGYPRIKTFYGDGYEGLPDLAPFDKIIITAAAPEIPPKLVAQLKPGGLMVIPVGEVSEVQEMLRVTKSMDKNEVSIKKLGGFRFVPMKRHKAEESIYTASKSSKR